MEFGNICLLVLISAFAAHALKWKNCDSNDPAQVREFNLAPANPIVVRKGAKVRISGSAEIRGNPGVNYRLQLKIQKKVWFWITIPCMGYCSHEISCQKIWQILQKPAQCPVAQGVHSLPSTIVTIPDVSLPSFLASGKYKVKGSLYNKDSNRRIGCVEAEFSIRT